MNTVTNRNDMQSIGFIHRNVEFSKAILFWSVRLFRKIKGLIFQLFIHFFDACYDLYRYARYSSAFNHSVSDRQRLESLLFFYYHKIEKAMTLPNVKPLFGLSYIETTLDLAEKWGQTTGDLDAVVFRGAYAALAQYQKHVEQALLQTQPRIALRLNQFLTDYAQTDPGPTIGGTKTISFPKNQTIQEDTYFECFLRRRHSVRNFSERHIPDSVITKAVHLAQQTPSVCNRQCWRIHVFTTPLDKAKILQYQNGNEGFGHLADRVLLLTADLRSFFSSGERHQAMVDTGMFSMTLILALQAQGVASCCLNLCLSASREIALRRASGILDCEVPVMLVVIGYPPESLDVAIAARKPTESMLTFHDRASEN